MPGPADGAGGATAGAGCAPAPRLSAREQHPVVRVPGRTESGRLSSLRSDPLVVGHVPLELRDGVCVQGRPGLPHRLLQPVPEVGASGRIVGEGLLGERGELSVVVVAVDLEVILPADERGAVSELEQEHLEPVDQG